jgi:hypothetical protein
MISLLHLNKLKSLLFFLIFLSIGFAQAEENAIDLWDDNETKINESERNEIEKNISIESPILSEDVNKVAVKIEEDKIKSKGQSVIGIFDPEENNFNLDMWSRSDGTDIKKILTRINKLNLSKLSEDLLFQVLFTNAYAPKKNLTSEEFLKIKINWLIKKERINDLEILLKNNLEVGHNPKAIKFLINEYLSLAQIKSACNVTNSVSQKVKNFYLDKFKIYCLIHNDRKDEAQLIFELLKEKGFNEKFFEDKINFLLGITETTTQKILDDSLLNFYLSHITSNNFEYEPTEKTDKYIWQYLSSSNLIQVDSLEDESVISTYEQAAAQNSFKNSEIFKIYLKVNFNFNQLVNVQELYKNLPNYKARALIYQSILLTDNIEKKINLAFLLKDVFNKDKLLNIYEDELSNILESIDPNKVPENYVDLVNQNYNKNLSSKIKFDNSILHRSKVIRHFLENDKKIARTEKDFKTVYKKIKKNKKYFISIKDIVVLESLVADGISLPNDLDYNELSSQLTIPNNLQDLASQNQIGLVMLKVVEIIGEDNIRDLDPETLYFLNRILNDLNLKKIRNNILSEVLPIRV